MKTGNDYKNLLSFYDLIPKAVLAAVAVPYATGGGDHPERGGEQVAREWQLLHENGMVPQKPPADVLKLARKAEEDAEASTR
jgi:hypothetical protein